MFSLLVSFRERGDQTYLEILGAWRRNMVSNRFSDCAFEKRELSCEKPFRFTNYMINSMTDSTKQVLKISFKIDSNIYSNTTAFRCATSQTI